MIQKVENPKFEVPEGYLEGLRARIRKYDDRYAVLMHDTTIKHDNEEYRLDKGTLIQIQVNYNDALKVYRSVSIKGVIGNEIKEFTVYEKSLERLSLEMDEQVPPPIKDYKKALTAYSGEQCLDYIENHFGVIDELDKECKKLYKLNNTVECGNEIGIVSALLAWPVGLMCAIGGITGSASGFLGTPPVAILIGVLLWAYATYTIIHTCKAKQRLITKWLETDEKTTNIVALIESGAAGTKELKESKRLGILSPLLGYTKEPGYAGNDTAI